MYLVCLLCPTGSPYTKSQVQFLRLNDISRIYEHNAVCRLISFFWRIVALNQMWVRMCMFS